MLLSSEGQVAGEAMSEYLPFAGEHSIQEAAIAVHFQGELEPQQIELTRGRAHADLNADFGRSQEIRGGNINIDMSDPETPAATGSARVVGFEFSRPEAGGTSGRILRFANNALSAAFTEYTEWNRVLADSLTYIKTVLSSVPLADIPIVAFSLRYVDRYSFAGPVTDARADLLFESDSPYLASRCFTAGPLWHCHSGWFEDSSDEERILNQLNVGSAVVDGASAVTIDHTAVWMLKSPRQSTDALFSHAEDRTGLREALNRLHDGNKEILKGMLRHSMIARIGMTS